jgi:hypothetical protein
LAADDHSTAWFLLGCPFHAHCWTLIATSFATTSST